MASFDQFVVPRGDGWAVRKSTSVRVTRHFNTQEEALTAARRIAQNQGCDVIIFGEDGIIRGPDSLVNNPLPQGQ